VAAQLMPWRKCKNSGYAFGTGMKYKNPVYVFKTETVTYKKPADTFERGRKYKNPVNAFGTGIK
jgi:hypothetical protein